jgi:uncharacterized protein YodC (DUF2158 family)
MHDMKVSKYSAHGMWFWKWACSCGRNKSKYETELLCRQGAATHLRAQPKGTVK